ncbi:DUF4998 domain-containing protein [uncultured Proteiniphilum sp.]|uniref:DUF4998 domain-containing protein n=1 Tax=uncultured Proteiniphilum sp. TaxID=497637 RepID=UPI002621137E|nr:DUF4998 domain-containing protein [uncultured Proteiniphilum sp.]
MNNLINKTFYILYISLFAGFLSCGDMDDTYRHFWQDGEKVYPAPADSLKIFTGKNRVGISWRIFGDPNVNMTKIFWNNRSDSLQIPIEPKQDSAYIVIDNLAEGSYSFEVFTYDQKGNRSVPRNGIGTVYGDTYARTLLPRFLQSALYAEDTLKITWGNMGDNSSIGSELYYRNISGTQKKLMIKNNAETTIILDYDSESGGPVTYRTIYVPPMSIDTFYTNMQTVAVKGAPLHLPKAGWTATASSFDSRTGSSYRPPAHTIDNNLTTIWVNQISPQTYYPHTLTIDMGSIIENVSGISLIVERRNETPKSIIVEVSQNGNDWNPMGTYNVENIATTIQTFDFHQDQNIRFFRMTAIAPWGSTNNIAITEAGAYTYTR